MARVRWTSQIEDLAAWRKEINPKPPQPTSDQANTSRGLLVRGHGVPCPAPDRRAPWANLLYRVFGIDGLPCPRCQQRMKLKAVVIGHPATSRILEGLASVGSRARPPPVGASPAS